MSKKILYDTFVVLSIAAVLIPISIWSGIVAVYYSLTTLPGQLLQVADIYYNSNVD